MNEDDPFWRVMRMSGREADLARVWRKTPWWCWLTAPNLMLKHLFQWASVWWQIWKLEEEYENRIGP